MNDTVTYESSLLQSATYVAYFLNSTFVNGFYDSCENVEVCHHLLASSIPPIYLF